MNTIFRISFLDSIFFSLVGGATFTILQPLWLLLLGIVIIVPYRISEKLWQSKKDNEYIWIFRALIQLINSIFFFVLFYLISGGLCKNTNDWLGTCRANFTPLLFISFVLLILSILIFLKGKFSKK